VLEEHPELAASMWARFGVSVEFQGRAISADQVDALVSRYGIKSALIRAALDVQTVPADDEVTSIEALFADPEIRQEFKAFTSSGNPVRINVAHRFARPTEADRRDKMAAIQLVETRKEKATAIRWDKLAEIYGRLIQSVDGCLWRGAPCVAGNKIEWVHAVPLSARVIAAMTLLEAAEQKNG
jgi:hypothetical protein